MKHRGSVLVVDDDRLVLTTLVHELSEAGFNVLQTDNGDDAILLARQHRPQIVLLDIRMQGLNGFDVAQYLRDYGRIPFLFLSAYSDEPTLARARELGALDCLSKPIRTPDLVEALDRHLLQLASETPTPVSAVLADPAAQTLSELSLAVGLLMHRFSLDRDQALERLANLARLEGQSPFQTAQSLLNAQERLARAGALNGF